MKNKEIIEKVLKEYRADPEAQIEDYMLKALSLKDKEIEELKIGKDKNPFWDEKLLECAKNNFNEGYNKALKKIGEEIENIFSEGWYQYMWTSYCPEDKQIGEDMINDIVKKVKEISKIINNHNEPEDERAKGRALQSKSNKRDMSNSSGSDDICECGHHITSHYPDGKCHFSGCNCKQFKQKKEKI